MLKLYKRSGGVLHYHEAWADGQKVIEHWGLVGEKGHTKEHQIPRRKSTSVAIGNILAPAIQAGFGTIAMEHHSRLLIEYAVDGMGTREDLDKRHALEDRMNETLGWTGLGTCDGGSIGSNTMEVCCFVVDFETAKRTVEADLADTEFSNFTRIYDEDA